MIEYYIDRERDLEEMPLGQRLFEQRVEPAICAVARCWRGLLVESSFQSLSHITKDDESAAALQSFLDGKCLAKGALFDKEVTDDPSLTLLGKLFKNDYGWAFGVFDKKCVLDSCIKGYIPPEVGDLVYDNDWMFFSSDDFQEQDPFRGLTCEEIQRKLMDETDVDFSVIEDVERLISMTRELLFDDHLNPWRKGYYRAETKRLRIALGSVGRAVVACIEEEFTVQQCIRPLYSDQ